MMESSAKSVIPLLVVISLGCVHGLGLFHRIPWNNEVGKATVESWFDLISAGKEQGKDSPYYVETLALQNIACNQLYPIGPPCNASAPSHTKQAKGDSNLPYASLWKSDLEILRPYLPLFETVYVGTVWLDVFDVLNTTMNAEAAELQGKVGKEFLEQFPSMDNFAWYITEEASLNTIGESATLAHAYSDFLEQTMAKFRSIRAAPVLWSPVFNVPYNSYNDSQLLELKTNLMTLFCSLSHPLRLEFQDYLGQSVTFRFPFHYNYTQQHSCEGDTKPYYNLLQEISQTCNGLGTVKVNAEMFAERLSDAGEHGENNGANIINASPQELSERLECYKTNDIPVGNCWALPHWYYINSFANATVYRPY